MDREKVIKGVFEMLQRDTWKDIDQERHRFQPVLNDVLKLLKEQEAVEPYSMNAERTYGICPKCGKIVFRYGNVEENHYCGVCGQAVKWE